MELNDIHSPVVNEKEDEDERDKNSELKEDSQDEEPLILEHKNMEENEQKNESDEEDGNKEKIFESHANRNNNRKNIKERKEEFYRDSYDYCRQLYINEGSFDTDELFKKAIDKEKGPKTGMTKVEVDQDGNTLGTKVTNALYDKFVTKNKQKSKHPDFYAKIKDEEIRQGREAKRTKDDAKKINEMIVRQEDYEKIKSENKRKRQKEVKNQIKEVQNFLHNTKNISIKNSQEFLVNQKKFIEKKEKTINKMNKEKLDSEAKDIKISLVSKNSEKLANLKYPNETPEEFYSRLAGEKLKSIKESYNMPKVEKKIISEKEILDLTNKLYKEGEQFKNKREQKEKEEKNKLRNVEKNNFLLDNSKKVLFDKFKTKYENILEKLFGQKDNFEINFEQYKTLLVSLGFIKENSSLNENLVQDSFDIYLKQCNGVIETYSFLIFGLALLGIFKGNDEKFIEHLANVPKQISEKEHNITENEDKKHEVKQSYTLYNQMKKNKLKTGVELINAHIPDLDLEKYGFSSKTYKIIKTKFFPFVKALSEFMSNDFKKKRKTLKKEITKVEKKPKYKTDDDIHASISNKILQQKLSNLVKGNPHIYAKSNKLKDMNQIYIQKKAHQLEKIKEKEENKISNECTFQPNYKEKTVNRKELEKNIEKLYYEGKKNYRKKILQEETKDLDYDNKKNCTFQPSIKMYNGKYFKNNPLKEDKLLNKTLEKKKGLTMAKEFKRKNEKNNFAFLIEPKSNKDDISQRVISEKGTRVSVSEVDSYLNFDDDGHNATFKFQVLFSNNQVKYIIIAKDENYIKKVEDFCIRNRVNDSVKVKLLKIIKDTIMEN